MNQINFPASDKERDEFVELMESPHWRIERMYELNGKADEETCESCRYLYRPARLRERLRCSRFGDGASKYADWEPDWNACGLFEKRP